MDSELAPLLKLGRAERIQLVEDLWDSIANEQPSLPVPTWKADELRARKERLQNDPSAALTWEQVAARARAQNA